MIVIGITGGVGSGKSALLSYIKENYNCRILLADEAAHKVKEPGQPCFQELMKLLPHEVLDADGSINKGRMAAEIFGSEKLLEKVNQIIHPAVKSYIQKEIALEREKNRILFFFVEAALLIEDGYLNIVDEMWYIYAQETVRRQRLLTSRGYTKEKIQAIMDSQLTEEEFRKNCGTVIDNSDSFEDACRQIDAKMREYL